MPITADCHLHSSHSGDSDTPMETQIRAAIRSGLTTMCFTEHYDPDFPYDDDLPDLAPGTFELDMEAYREEFLLLKRKYEGQIRLLCGVELGLQDHLGERLRSFTAAHPELDLVIGSTHLCRGRDPYYPSFLNGITQEEALRAYLEGTLNNVRAFSGFDTCGHLDYVVRYLPDRDRLYTYEAYADLIDAILEELVRRGIALEVNTAPLSKGMRHFNPLPEILRRYREMGGDLLTIGSDAHVPEKIAGHFEETASILRDLGFRSYAVFVQRRPEILPL